MTHQSTVESISKLKRLIHVGKRELGLDDDTYRSLLATTVKGKDSTTQMTKLELERVVDAMKARGFKVKGARAQTRRLADDPQAKLIRHLWLDLHGRGYVRDSNESSLVAYVRRLVKVAAVQWLSTEQASSVIESLKKWSRRDVVKIEQLLQQCTGRQLLVHADIGRLCRDIAGFQGEPTAMPKTVADQLLSYLQGLLDERK